MCQLHFPPFSLKTPTDMNTIRLSWTCKKVFVVVGEAVSLSHLTRQTLAVVNAGLIYFLLHKTHTLWVSLLTSVKVPDRNKNENVKFDICEFPVTSPATRWIDVCDSRSVTEQKHIRTLKKHLSFSVFYCKPQKGQMSAAKKNFDMLSLHSGCTIWIKYFKTV